MKEYIEDARRERRASRPHGERSFMLSPGRKAQSLSNLSMPEESWRARQRQQQASNLNKMKAFISSSQLDKTKITLSRNGLSRTINDIDRLDRAR